MAKGKYSVVHRGSDGAELASSSGLDEDSAVEEAEAIISELEGDSGATLTVTWEN